MWVFDGEAVPGRGSLFQVEGPKLDGERARATSESMLLHDLHGITLRCQTAESVSSLAGPGWDLQAVYGILDTVLCCKYTARGGCGEEGS